MGVREQRLRRWIEGFDTTSLQVFTIGAMAWGICALIVVMMFILSGCEESDRRGNFILSCLHASHGTPFTDASADLVKACGDQAEKLYPLKERR